MTPDTATCLPPETTANLVNAHHQAAMLVRAWLDAKGDYDTQVWPVIQKELEEDRLELDRADSTAV